METILRISYYRRLSNVSLQKAMELFLTENPDGELRKGKRRLSGYTISSKSKGSTGMRKQGLFLEVSDEEEEADDDATAHHLLVQPGEDLSDENNSSSDDDDEDGNDEEED